MIDLHPDHIPFVRMTAACMRVSLISGRDLIRSMDDLAMTKAADYLSTGMTWDETGATSMP